MTENNIAKNIGLIYKAEPYLNKDSLLTLYFSYIHSYINYDNLVRESTNRTYLRKINSQQKHTLVLIHKKNRFHHPKERFDSCEILNLYNLNLLNTAVFIEEPTNSCPIRVSSGNYKKAQIKLRKCRFQTSIRGPAIWNNLVGSAEKEIQSSSLYKTKI